MYPELSWGSGKQSPVPSMIFIFILSSDLKSPQGRALCVTDFQKHCRSDHKVERVEFTSRHQSEDQLSVLVVERSVSLLKALGMCLKMHLKRLV